MNEMSPPRGRSTRTRERQDAGPPLDADPRDGYGPPATIDQSRDDAALAVSSISEQMGGAQPVQVVAPPMLPAKVSSAVTKRVAAVMAAADWIEKRGDNKFHGYKYATIDDMRAAVGKLCGNHGLAWRQDEIRAYPVGPKLLAVTYQFSLYAEDEPEAECFPSRVTVLAALMSNKGGMDDKAFSKARSLAWKDWAKSQFAIPTGDGDDDPERDDRPPQDERRREGRDAKSRLDDIAETRKRPTVPKAKSADDWAASALKVIEEIASLADLEAMIRAEKKNLDMLSDEYPDLDIKVQGAIRDARARLKE